MVLVRILEKVDPAVWKLVRWSAMAAFLFWMFVYHASLHTGNLPDFVYVNF